jgi:hypothetical protein
MMLPFPAASCSTTDHAHEAHKEYLYDTIKRKNETAGWLLNWIDPQLD